MVLIWPKRYYRRSSRPIFHLATKLALSPHCIPVVKWLSYFRVVYYFEKGSSIEVKRTVAGLMCALPDSLLIRHRMTGLIDCFILWPHISHEIPVPDSIPLEPPVWLIIHGLWISRFTIHHFVCRNNNYFAHNFSEQQSGDSFIIFNLSHLQKLGDTQASR